MPDDSRPQDEVQPRPAETEPRPAETDPQSSGGAAGVVVLGMSRSGTSAVSEAFVRSGFFAGRDPDLMPPTEDNPRGYWENIAVYRCNEAVLGELDATWFDPPSPDLMNASAHLRDRLRAALDLLIETAAPAPVVLKDPRIGVLLDLWGPVIESRLHPVLVIRSPTEVASSLATRDGTPRALGLAGWEVHLTRVLHYLRGRTVTVAPYAALLADPGQASMIVEAAAGHLAAGRRALVDGAAASTAMIADLRRERPDIGELAECLTRPQARLWEILGGLPAGDQVIELPSDFTGEPPDTALEAARDETRRVADRRVATDRGIRLDALTAERDTLTAERDTLTAERDTLTAERDILTAERDTLTAERDTLTAERDILTAERDTLTAERDILTGERDATRIEREQLADELAGERGLVAELRAELGRAVYQVDERSRHRAERDRMAEERDAIATERDAIAADLAAADRTRSGPPEPGSP